MSTYVPYKSYYQYKWQKQKAEEIQASYIDYEELLAEKGKSKNPTAKRKSTKAATPKRK